MQEASQAKSGTNVRALRELESAFRVAYSRDEHGRAPVRPKASTEDWSTTLNLIEETAGALHSAEQRIRELEQRQEELLRAARANLQKAKASIDASEAQALKAEQRAKEAEERAKHCQEWLTRIHEGLEQLPKQP
jgi:predicted Rossmann fold nucleotide-binding protein DprA/Smf involved in DNA uptake